MFDLDGVNNDGTNNGVWVEFNGGEFLIAHTSSLKFQREFSKLQQPHIKKIERGTLDPKITTDILCKAMARALLLDWKNVGSNDAPVEYTQDLAYKVLVSNPELREFVQDTSLNIDNFKREVTEQEGNFSQSM